MNTIKTNILYVLSVHFSALLFMSSQRLVLLITNLQQIETVETKFSWISSALLRGIWFDNVVACYISLFPLVVFSIAGLFNFTRKILFNVFNVYYIVIYLLTFGIGTANIPYFRYFFKHLNMSAFGWIEETGTALRMIFGETSYYVYMVFYLVSITLFGCLLYRIGKRLMKEKHPNLKLKQYAVYLPACSILVGLCLFGIRGRTGYNSIKTSQAYFSDNAFLNQLGINPLFYLTRDMLETSKKHYNADAIISEEKSIPIVRKALGIDSLPYRPGDSPIAREVIADGAPKQMNVIVVFLESMSAELLKIKEKGKEITPFLNQLIDKSYYFSNFYSSGTHTNQGVVTTLYGIPALFNRNMMKNVDIPLCEGLPYTLRQYGYHTMFFMTHEAQYDNMNAFLKDNGVEDVYSEEDYPRDKRRNCFGVADDFLFEYGMNVINEKAKDNRPFFAALLTISNHPPYVVPDAFRTVSDEPEYQIVAFADNALRVFMEEAEKQEWYDNTIFVLLGDHGKIVGQQVYEMPLSYNHVPCIIYSPAFKDIPREFDRLGGQVDVFPTVMGLLNYSYQNNTFGIDLFKSHRSYMFFSSDNALGGIDSDNFYVYNFKVGTEGLYNYRENKPENLISGQQSLAKEMSIYSAAMHQTTNYMLRKGLTRTTKSERAMISAMNRP